MLKDVTHWQTQYENSYSDYQTLQIEHEQIVKQYQLASKQVQEQKTIEQNQIDRYNRLEYELRITKNQLVECTHASAESESTISALKRTITELQSENKSLHTKIKTIYEKLEKERLNLQESLTQVEQSAQKLRLQNTAFEDDIQRYKLDISSNDKQISQYKMRITNLERRLTEATTTFGNNSNSGSSSSSSNINSNSANLNVPWKNDDETNALIPALTTSLSSYQDNNTSSKKSSITNSPFMIPPLRSASSFVSPPQPNNNNLSRGDLSNRKDISSSSPCCICQKNPFGLMKPCQCGEPECNKRAHATCISKKFRNASGGQVKNNAVILCGSNGANE